VQLLDQSLSRRHCRVFPSPDGWLVEDLGSHGGTLLNGAPIRQPALLRRRDRLQIGPMSAHLVPRPPERSVLSGDVERDARNIDLVLRTIGDLYGPDDLPQLLRTIVDRTVLLAGADRGALLLEGGGEALEIAVARDADGQDLPPDQILTRALPGRALQTGRAVVLTDAQAPDQQHDATQSVYQGQLRSVLCVPLPGLQKPIGVLYADGRRPAEEFGSGELAVFEALAVHGAIAIERARLRQERSRQ
jgi:transcriptional regulator with GAF, ATPase, and Fis domain